MREGATKIILAAGFLITLFVAMNSLKQGFLDFLMNLIPGLAIVGLGILSKYFPRVTGVLIFIITVGLEFAIFSKGLNWAQFGTALIVGIPLLIAGVCLYIPDKNETEIEPVKSV